MPGRDGTGPLGNGPRGFGRSLGRGLGICRNIEANPEARLAFLELAQKEISAQIEKIKSAK